MHIPEELILEQFELGPIGNFLYIVGDANSKEVALIDPAWDVNHICERVNAGGYTVVSILLTHCHPDHINGLDEALSHYDVPVYVSKHALPALKPTGEGVIEVEDQAKIKVGSIEFTCLLAPGHSPGSHMLLYKNVLITGDVVFIDGCGRCDLPGSDPKQQYHSLTHVLMPLPDDTILFTGHNYGPTPTATLGEQKQTNPYLTAADEREFLVTRMGVSY